MTRDSGTDSAPDQPTISGGPDPGTVSVETIVPVSRDEAWDALYECDMVARWFGDLSGPMTPGARLRLDFGDGDFFDIDVSKVEPPHSLGYRWRFLGIGSESRVEWQLYDRGSTRVVVEDSVPARSRTESNQIGTGWFDFLDRYARFVHTGKSTRYAWRTELDGSVELPRNDERLLDADLRPSWLPLTDSTSLVGTMLEVPAPEGPWTIPVTRIARRSRRQLELGLGGPDDRAASACLLELEPTEGGGQLAFAHDDWPRIVPPGADLRAARSDLTRMWVDAMRRARALLTG